MASAAAEYEVVGKYNSRRNPDNVYEVYRFASGELRCSCPGWRFSKATPKSCRHIKRVVEGLDDDAAVAERAERAIKFLDVFTTTPIAIYSYEVEQVREAIPHAARKDGTKHSHQAKAENIMRLLDALDASGIFAPRPSRPEVTRSRGARLITLDD